MKTRAATEARMCAVDKRMAERLTRRGWTVTPPERPAVDPHECEDPLACSRPGPHQMPEPCAAGCSDPEAHAEGGHDV